MSKFQKLVEKTGASPDDVLACLIKIYRERIEKAERGGAKCDQE
mgnify:CR=1 FL=1